MKVHVVPTLGGVRLQQLGVSNLNVLYADLLTNGRRDENGGLSPRTVRYVHTILRKALADAVDWDRVARNVADKANAPSAKATKAKAPRTWDAAELRAFLDSIASERDYPLFHLLSSTGLRRGEALGAHWRDVDLENATWGVRDTLVAIAHQAADSTPKTEGGRRSVALDPGTVRVLREWRKRQIEDRMKWEPAWTDSGRVFTREDGTDLHPERVSERFDRLVTRAKLPRLTLHGLRHTWATLALRAGVHPKVVQERLGHASVAFTLDRYSHAIPAMQDEAAAKVAELVMGVG